ncbi:hypothetical protein ABPG72_018310 [Tetrahymena utriculariae]
MNKLIAIIVMLFTLVLADIDICYKDNNEMIYCHSGYKCCNINKCCRDYGSLWWVYLIVVIVVVLLCVFGYKLRSRCNGSQTQANNSQQAPLLQDRPSNTNNVTSGFRLFQGNAISLQGNNNVQRNDNNNNV